MSTSSANSTASPAVSGLDYDDTALTLALPGSSSSSSSDPAASDRKRAHAEHDKPPSPKARAVGWPPVRAYRRNALRDEAAKLVKVAVDGAPYLRKVDLAAHDGYAPLLRALHAMFASCLVANGAGRLVDAATGAEYVPTYEDRDGDWMLVGDVPFKMFVESCKRIRLMKSSEADNLGKSSPQIRADPGYKMP
nr:unnamed protein product [Digitaria exilis]